MCSFMARRENQTFLSISRRPSCRRFPSGGREEEVGQNGGELQRPVALNAVAGPFAPDDGGAGLAPQQLGHAFEHAHLIGGTGAAARQHQAETTSDGAQQHADVRARVIAALLKEFAAHDSMSVQHTLFDMGKAALAAAPEIARITLTMPNLHHLLADLSPFGRDNPNHIFVPIDEPHGYIEATVER